MEKHNYFTSTEDISHLIPYIGVGIHEPFSALEDALSFLGMTMSELYDLVHSVREEG